MDMQYECDNAFPNLKCVLELFPRKNPGAVLNSMPAMQGVHAS